MRTPVATTLLLCASLSAHAAPATVTEARFGNGMRILFLEDHALPTVYLGLMFKGSGSASDPSGKTGVAAITASLLREGTKTRSARDLAQQVDFIGASLGAFADVDRTMVSASGLSRDLPRLLDLLADITLRPAFKQEEFDRVKSRTLAAIARSLDDADGVAGRGLDRFMLGDHPYALPSFGSEATARAIQLADVTAFHQRHYRADNAVLVVAGDMQPASITPLLQKAFETFAPGTAAPAPPATTPVARRTKILLLDKPDLTQAKIAFGHVGIPREHPDYYPALVANGVLGGTGFLSRLMKEVRSNKGLTYGIRSGFDARKAGGTFTVSTSTRTEATVQAIQAAQAEIIRLQEKGPDARELDDVKNYLVGSYALGIETVESQASVALQADLYNLGTDHVRAHPQKIRAVTAADVSRAATTLWSPGALRIVVVGNAEELKGPLSTLGDVEVRPHSRWAE